METPWLQTPSMHGLCGQGGYDVVRENDYPARCCDRLESYRSYVDGLIPNSSPRVYNYPQPGSQAFESAQLPTPTSGSGAYMQSTYLQDMEQLQETHGSQSALPSPQATPIKANLANFASGSRTQDAMTFDGEPYSADTTNVYTPTCTPNIHTSYGGDVLPSPSVWHRDYSQDVQTQGRAPLPPESSLSGSLEPLPIKYEHPYFPRRPPGESKYHAALGGTQQGDMIIPIPAVVKSKSAPPGLFLHGSIAGFATRITLEEPQPTRSLSRKRWESPPNLDSSIPRRRKIRTLTTAGRAHATAVRKSAGGACKLCRKKKIKCLHKLPEDRALHRALHTLATFDPDVRKTETGARSFDPMLSSPLQDFADLETGGLI